jgi:signal transduction histidine kinase
MNHHDADPSTAMEGMRTDIRQICHDLSNPLGILRMAVYFLQSVKGDPEKRAHYYMMMNESLDKMEVHLKRLRSLAVDEQKQSEL